MNKVINVAVLVYPGVEVIDMNGPIDVFIKANSFNGNRYRVYTVAESPEPVKSENSAVQIIPEYTLTNCPRTDILVIPGQIMPTGSTESFGRGSDTLRSWITGLMQTPETIIMSVCVGIYILAKTGLLANRKATTHFQALVDIQKEYKDITFIKNVRFIPDGNFITTGGVTSGIDGALYLVSVLDSPCTAQKVADIMVYNREAPLPVNTILYDNALLR